MLHGSGSSSRSAANYIPEIFRALVTTLFLHCGWAQQPIGTEYTRLLSQFTGAAAVGISTLH